jgi:hypothetical protein
VTAAATSTLYEGARPIAGDGGAPVESAAFIVENGRVTQASPLVPRLPLRDRRARWYRRRSARWHG